jgi:hypothetical protein
MASMQDSIDPSSWTMSRPAPGRIGPARTIRNDLDGDASRVPYIRQLLTRTGTDAPGVQEGTPLITDNDLILYGLGVKVEPERAGRLREFDLTGLWRVTSGDLRRRALHHRRVGRRIHARRGLTTSESTGDVASKGDVPAGEIALAGLQDWLEITPRRIRVPAVRGDGRRVRGRVYELGPRGP